MTADRRAQIIRLLNSRDQHLPDVSRNESPLATAGFKHGIKVHETCPECLGEKITSELQLLIGDCETCEGRGYVTVLRDHDPYANKGQGFYRGGEQHDRTYAIDRAIATAASELSRFAGFRPQTEADVIAGLRPEGWERKRASMYRDYDFAALDRGMEMLASVDEDAHSLIVRVYEYGWLPEPRPGTAVAAMLDRGLAFVDKWMPDPIRAPGGEPAPTVGRGPAHRNAGAVLIDRDRGIADQVLVQGMSSAEVAVLAGLSVRRVNEIVKRHAERSAA